MTDEKAPLVTYWMAYGSYCLLMLIGLISQWIYRPKVATPNSNRDTYAPLYDRFESFYCQYIYRRIRDCWNRPVCSAPGATISLRHRKTYDYGWTFM